MVERGCKEVRDYSDVVTLEVEASAIQPAYQSSYDVIYDSAKRYPETIAIHYVEDVEDASKDLKISYQQLLTQVNKAANLFSNLAGEQAPTVSYILPNLPQTHYTIWGAEACGIVNAINPFLEVEKTAALLNSVQANILVTLGPGFGQEQWSKVVALTERVSSLSYVLLINPTGDESLPSLGDVEVLDFDQSLNVQVSEYIFKPRLITPQTIASYFHTGGTTGTPKIAKHTHLNEVANAWNCCLSVPASPGSVCLVGLPLFHVNAVIATGLSAFMKGQTVLLAGMNGYRTAGLLANFWRLIERYQVATFSCVPTILSALIEVPIGEANIESLDFAICGAAPLSPKLMESFEAKTGARVLEGYGLTEAGCVSTLNPVAGERKVGSIGLRLPNQPLKIVVLNDAFEIVRECAEGEIGSLLVKGDNVFPGYLDESKNAGVLLADGWLNTGDLARIDSDGYVWLTGREKDLIIRGGHNIDPGEIEDILMGHPAIASVAAVGQPDAYAGELPCAYVCFQKGQKASEKELIEYVRSRISERAAVPVFIGHLEIMPVTAVGKIFKPEVRRIAMMRVVDVALREAGVTAHVVADADITSDSNLIITSDAAALDVGAVLRDYNIGYTLNEPAVVAENGA